VRLRSSSSFETWEINQLLVLMLVLVLQHHRPKKERWERINLKDK
jgi:hypothetical protein